MADPDIPLEKRVLERKWCTTRLESYRSRWARSIQPKFPEISVQNSMDRLGPTGKVSKKRVHLLRWTTFPGWNFGWMDRARDLQACGVLKALIRRSDETYYSTLFRRIHMILKFFLKRLIDFHNRYLKSLIHPQIATWTRQTPLWPSLLQR